MDNDKAAEVNCPHSFIPGHCGDIDALQITRTVEVEHSWPLVPEDEATITIHSEVDKPVVVVLPQLRVYIVLQPLFHNEQLRRRAPPMRLERIREHGRVVEAFLLFRHCNAVKPSKHVAVRREPDDRDVLPALEHLEKAIVLNWSTVL